MVTSLAWARDGRTLASAAGTLGSTTTGTDRVRLWTAQGSQGPVLTGHTGRVTSLGWAPDGNVLASGSLDGTVRLWRADGTAGQSLKTDAGEVFSVAWSPDGERLAVGASRTPTDNTAEIWRRDGSLQSTLHTSDSGAKFFNAAWSPDSRYLAAGAVDYGLWDANGTLLGRTGGGTPAWSLAWAPDSRRWAVGNESSSIQLLDLTATPLTQLFTEAGVDTMAWDTVLVAGGEMWAADGTPMGSLGHRTGMLDLPITSLAWSADGSIIAAGNKAGDVGLFNAVGDRLLLLAVGGSRRGEQAVHSLAWSPDGRVLAAGYGDAVARLWQVGDVLIP